MDAAGFRLLLRKTHKLETGEHVLIKTRTICSLILRVTERVELGVAA